MYINNEETKGILVDKYQEQTNVKYERELQSIKKISIDDKIIYNTSYIRGVFIQPLSGGAKTYEVTLGITGAKYINWGDGSVTLPEPDVTTFTHTYIQGDQGYYANISIYGATGISSISGGTDFTSDYVSGIDEICIADNVESINYGALRYCENLSSLTIPFVGGAKNITATWLDSSSTDPNYTDYTAINSQLFTYIFYQSQTPSSFPTNYKRFDQGTYLAPSGSANLYGGIPASLGSVEITMGNTVKISNGNTIIHTKENVIPRSSFEIHAYNQGASVYDADSVNVYINKSITSFDKDCFLKKYVNLGSSHRQLSYKGSAAQYETIVGYVKTDSNPYNNDFSSIYTSDGVYWSKNI